MAGEHQYGRLELRLSSGPAAAAAGGAASDNQWHTAAVMEQLVRCVSPAAHITHKYAVHHQKQHFQQQQQQQGQQALPPPLGTAAAAAVGSSLAIGWGVQQQGMQDPPQPSPLSSLSLAPTSHPHLAPFLAAALHPSSATTCLLTPPAPCTLARVLRFCPETLGSDMDRRFLLYQLLLALSWLHEQGLALGGLSLGQVRLVNGSSMVQLLAVPVAGAAAATEVGDPGGRATASTGEHGSSKLHHHAGKPQQQQQQDGQAGPVAAWQQHQQQHQEERGGQEATWHQSSHQQQQQQQQQESLLPVGGPCVPLPSLAELMSGWQRGAISNLDYLLWMNLYAGGPSG